MGSLCRVTVMGRDPYTYFNYLIRMTSKPEPEHREFPEKLGFTSLSHRVMSRKRQKLGGNRVIPYPP